MWKDSLIGTKVAYLLFKNRLLFQLTYLNLIYMSLYHVNFQIVRNFQEESKLFVVTMFIIVCVWRLIEPMMQTAMYIYL